MRLVLFVDPLVLAIDNFVLVLVPVQNEDVKGHAESKQEMRKVSPMRIISASANVRNARCIGMRSALRSVSVIYKNGNFPYKSNCCSEVQFRFRSGLVSHFTFF